MTHKLLKVQIVTMVIIIVTLKSNCQCESVHLMTNSSGIIDKSTIILLCSENQNLSVCVCVCH